MAEQRRTWDLLLRPRDPLILRDARPFSPDSGARAFTLDWPIPSTLAGALRTHIGNAITIDWDTWNPQKGHPLQQVAMRGGLRVDRLPDEPGWTVMVPAPADALIVEDENGARTIERLRPRSLAEGEGCNLPRINGSQLIPIAVETEAKPLTNIAYWSLEDIVRWLLGETQKPTRCAGRLEEDTRVHVGINRDTLTSVEGRLFATTGLAFGPAIRRPGAPGQKLEDVAETAILCQVGAPREIAWQPGRALVPLGGERRLVRLEPNPAVAKMPWQAPEELVRALVGQQRLRLQLVTPAIFRTGWYPGWLTQTHRDRNPAEVNGRRWTLRAAAIGRRIAISGWDTVHHCEKPIRYAVPAGSVYFFEIDQPLTEAQVRELWLAPLSDGRRNRRDGFGLALPGVWVD